MAKVKPKVKISKKKTSKKTTKKASKKVTKKASKKKTTKKKTSKKKVAKKAKGKRKFVTEEEKLVFVNGITEQKLYNERISNGENKIQLLVNNLNQKISLAKQAIERLKQEKKAAIQVYNSHLDSIRTRLKFEGGFGIHPETNEVILHGEEEDRPAE